MPLFTLTPDPEKWTLSDRVASTHYGPCRVAATDERRARLYAANAFTNRDAMRTEAGLLPASPWINRALVWAYAAALPGFDTAREGTILIPADPAVPLGRHIVFRQE